MDLLLLPVACFALFKFTSSPRYPVTSSLLHTVSPSLRLLVSHSPPCFTPGSLLCPVQNSPRHPVTSSHRLSLPPSLPLFSSCFTLFCILSCILRIPRLYATE